LSSEAVVGTTVSLYVRIEGKQGFDLTRFNTVQIVVTPRTPIVDIHELHQTYTPAVDRHAVFSVTMRQPGRALLDIRVLIGSRTYCPQVCVAEFNVVAAQ
jgi:hypothetical protein